MVQGGDLGGFGYGKKKKIPRTLDIVGKVFWTEKKKVEGRKPGKSSVAYISKEILEYQILGIGSCLKVRQNQSALLHEFQKTG